MKRWFLFLFLAALSGARAVFAQGFDDVTPTGFGVSVGTWISPNFSGLVKAGSGGTEMSLNHTLGLSSQTIFIPEIYYRWDHGQILDVRYQQYDQTVTQNLPVPESYQGSSLAAGTPVTTFARLQWGEISYELPVAYDKFPPHNGFLNVFLTINALRGTFTLNGTSAQNGNHAPITVPFPMVGVHGKYRMFTDGTSVEFKVSGIRAGFEDAVGWAYDYEVGINQQILSDFGITGKYRYATFYNRDADDNRFGFRLYGPEVDGVIRF